MCVCVCVCASYQKWERRGQRLLLFPWCHVLKGTCTSHLWFPGKNKPIPATSQNNNICTAPVITTGTHPPSGWLAAPGPRLPLLTGCLRPSFHEAPVLGLTAAWVQGSSPLGSLPGLPPLWAGLCSWARAFYVSFSPPLSSILPFFFLPFPYLPFPSFPFPPFLWHPFLALPIPASLPGLLGFFHVVYLPSSSPVNGDQLRSFCLDPAFPDAPRSDCVTSSSDCPCLSTILISPTSASI